MRRRSPRLLLAGLLTVSAACTDDVASSSRETVGGIGAEAPRAGSQPSDTTGGTDAGQSPATVVLNDGTFGPVVAADAPGNRLLLIGDSIFAAAAPRYGGEACQELGALDWEVQVEAETGQPIKFGETVMATVGGEDWDVFVLFLGTNYDGDVDAYRESLDTILTEMGDRPVVLVTTSRYRPEQDEVNSALRDESESRPNVVLLDWATASEAKGVLSGDDIHPSDSGLRLLIGSIAYVLGKAAGEAGGCLTSVFTDDSATGVRPRRSTTHTTAPRRGD